MHSYRAHRTDPESLVVNQRIVEAHVDSEHYDRWIYPMDMFADPGIPGAIVGGLTLRDHWMELKDADSPGVLWKFGRPTQWVRGRVETRIWYTGSVASASNIALTLRAYREKVGTNLTTMVAALAVASPAMPGPAAINNVLAITFTGYLAVDPQWGLLSWSLQRNTADAYTGVLRLLAVRHRYVPGRHEI